jgi:hypothetical protein
MSAHAPVARRTTSTGTQRAAAAKLARGFTLVELMVAITGGLFVSIAVFALARDGSRFYQRESRIAEATLGTVIGFDRLRNDIARAGFLSTPNIRSDPLLCGELTTYKDFPQLQQLASLQITTSGDTAVTGNKVLKAAGIKPQELLLSGAYNSVDRFDVSGTIFQQSTQYVVRLQTTSGALFRINYAGLNPPGRQQLLDHLFPPRRALRLVSNDTGTFQIGVINRCTEINGVPTIYLDQIPVLRLRGPAVTGCSLTPNQIIVNTVNFIKYSLRQVKGNTADFPNHQSLFSTGGPVGEDTRLELVREEIDADGNVATELDSAGNVAGTTRELIAEYAVDLNFAITRVLDPLGTARLETFDFGSDNVLTVAGPTGAGNVTARPQSVRSVRPRLSVRSREADRDANIDTTGGNIAPGLYRIGLGDSGTAPFARIRSLQADTLIGSQSDVTW